MEIQVNIFLSVEERLMFGYSFGYFWIFCYRVEGVNRIGPYLILTLIVICAPYYATNYQMIKVLGTYWLNKLIQELAKLVKPNSKQHVQI